MNAGYTRYKNTSIQSASKEKLLLMMYEGAIKFVKRGIMACEKKDIAARCENISRAYDIILELANTLDHKVGGDISKNLEQLYMFITDRLSKSNMNGGDPAPLKEVLAILETLYKGWDEAIKSLKNEGAEQPKVMNKAG